MRKLEPVDVAAVLAFLSWHVPLQDIEPGERDQQAIDTGRMLIFDWLRHSLEVPND